MARRRTSERVRARREASSGNHQMVGGMFMAALIGGGLYTLHGRPSDPERSSRTAILIDVSPTNETRRCEDVVATVRAELTAATDAAIDVTLYTTGDRSTGNSAVPLGAPLHRARPAFSIEGAAAASKAGTKEIDELATEAGARCAGAKGTNESPLFDSAASVLGTFDASWCAQSTHACRFVFRTDGVEEVEPIVLARLRGEPRDDAPRLVVAGLEVQLCGLGHRVMTARSKAPPPPTVQDVERAFGADFGPGVRFSLSCP